MSMNHRTSCHGIPRLYYLAYFTFLLALVIFAAGCNSKPSTDNGGVKPSPTPKAGGTESRRLGDTPIIISGGSFQLDLNRVLFAGANGNYEHTEDPLTKGWIYDNNVNGEAPLPLTDLENSEIVIYYRLNTGTPLSLLTITSDKDAHTVKVRFNESILVRRHGESNQYFSPGTAYKISQIVVTRKDGPTQEFNEGRELPDNNKIGLELFGVK